MYVQSMNALRGQADGCGKGQYDKKQYSEIS